MSQTNLENTVNNVADEVVHENVAPAVETTVEETETKRKSFFDVFNKKKKSTVEEATEATDAAAETAEAAEVPVEEKPAKKGRMCGLCAFGNKKKDEAAPEATEGEAATAEATEAAAAEDTNAATAAAPAEEATATATAEEATTATETAEEAPTMAAVATDATPTEEAAAAATEEATDAAAHDTTDADVSEPAVKAEDIARVGLLHKSGKWLKTRLNPRHCRLLHTGAFQWSKTEDFAGAHEIKLCPDTNTVPFMAEGESTEHKYRFELHCCKDVMTFACDSEEERDEWIRAFEAVKEKLAVPTEAAAASD